MDATALEELFAGTDDDALFMLDLLGEAARGRQANCFWEVCRTARRRGVTPEYVSDRASVLLASIEERRRSDVYRLLGVPPLADAEAVRHRWLEIAKREHPDVGGDAERFKRAKEAYELLKDPRRRLEYERYWLRALGPFERVAPARADEGPPPPPAAPTAPADESLAETTPSPTPSHAPRRVVMVGRRSADGAPAGRADVVAPPFAATAAAAPGARGSDDEPLSQRLAEVRAILARIRRAEVEEARREVAARIDALEGIKADLAVIARVRRVVLP